MIPCDTFADVRSAIHQIDLMLESLLAERRRYEQEAARFPHTPAEAAALAKPDALEATQRGLLAGEGTI